MADKKEKKQTYTTPRGVLVFPRLTTPDTKFKDCGEYSTKLRMSREDADKLIAQLQPLYDQAIKEAKVEYKAIPAVNPKNKKKKPEFSENPLFEEVLDDDNNETGDVAFKFAMNASGTSKKTGKDWERQPALFDAKGKSLTGKSRPDPWSGTVAKVSFTVGPYFMAATGAAGLKLYLEAVQIIDLRTGGGRDAGAYGFGAEEGYEGGDGVDEDSDAAPSGKGDESDDEPF